MFNLLKGIAGPAIKYLGSSVAGWGLNKLLSSNIAQSIIPKDLMPAIQKGANILL